MTRALAATPRTITAIRKADRLPRNMLPQQKRQVSAVGGRSFPSAGTVIYWAEITAVTDANNYTCDIYFSRANATADEIDKLVRVWDIVDTMAVGDWFPVIPSEVTDVDYECSQQMGAVG